MGYIHNIVSVPYLSIYMLHPSKLALSVCLSVCLTWVVEQEYPTFKISKVSIF